MADLGTMALMVALATCLYGVILPHWGVKTNNWNLIRSAQYATRLNFLLILFASSVLVYGLVISDFSIEYVWKHSSSDLPLFYKVTGFWGGLDGSLLFWLLVQSGYAMVIAFRYQYSNREIIPYVIATLNAIQAFLLILLLGWSNPLALQAVVPLEGRGLNPLLQNIAMVVHPPSLYLGFIGFSVPFAFAIGGMIRGKLDNEWVLTTRRWTLIAWYFLALGLILGGQWAYEELGWGGFWAWDPVENAAFMPFLTGSAFLHSVMIQEKRNTLKIWNIVLIIITFALTIVGTFLTRSGVVNSVHAFTQSNIGPAFLLFVAVALIVGFALLFKRINMLGSQYETDSLLCRENAFLAQNILFVSIAFTVLLGTTFPLFAEAIRGTKLSVQAPFFNTVVGPMGGLLLFLMGTGTVVAWKRSSWAMLRKNFQNPAILATLGLAGIWVFLSLLQGKSVHVGAYSLFWISIFVSATIFIEIIQATRAKSKQMSTNAFMGLIYVFQRNKRRYGGLIIHFGVVLMFMGFAGTFYSTETNLTLEAGKPVAVGNYHLEFQQIDEFKVRNATHRAATIKVTDKSGQFLEIMQPAKSFYPTQSQPLTEVALRRTFWEDLYLTLSSENGTDGGSVTLRVFINPLVGWAWMALPVFTLGVGICLTYRPKTLATREEMLKTRYLADA